MEITKTKPQYTPTNKTIASCSYCRKRYYSWLNLVDMPTCPYCNYKEKISGKLLNS